jgi:hypothetical protein
MRGSMKGRIPIDDAKRIATERRCPVVVIFGIEDEGNQFTVTSYGMTRKLCKLGASLADQFAEAIFSGKVESPAQEPPDTETDLIHARVKELEDWANDALGALKCASESLPSETEAAFAEGLIRRAAKFLKLT